MASKRVSRSRREGWPSIPEFFEGRRVLVTGATGFLGKVLVEKLLRSCPRIHCIYVLVRPKKGNDLQQRMADITALPLFTKIRREDPKSLEKIIPLKGDVCEKNLGLSEEDQETLIRDVSIIFHVAASVRFDDPLRKAILMNTRGTQEVLLLARKMKNLDSFMHVSTTYCNTHKDVIEEAIYPTPGDWKTLIKLAETMDQTTMEVFAPKILGSFPNSYTFTKGMAEQVVQEFQDDVPVLIFRPSIVISSLLEPMPGWVDNFNGPMGLMIASGKGIIKVVYSDPKIRADYVPVDFAVRAMIVTSWYKALSRNSQTPLPVYNCSSYGIKSITQRELVQVGSYVTREIPLNDGLWYPTADVTSCKFMYYLGVLFLHVLPAIAIDMGLKLTKRKPMLLRLQRKIFLANTALAYFLTKQWSFKNDKLFAVECEILESDKPSFSYRVDHVDVIEYFRNCTYGVRQYLLKEDNTELPEAKKHHQKLYWIDRGCKIGSLILGAIAIHQMRILPMIRAFVFDIINFFIKVFI